MEYLHFFQWLDDGYNSDGTYEENHLFFLYNARILL